jgi:aminoglycoside 6'-N-acetyltransferase I
MTIREIRETDQPDWVRLREALWPGSLSDHEVETRKYFARRSTALLVFVAEVEERIVGFLELDFRPYAPACSSSPVPFIEGWYVEPACQGRGIGRALVEAAKAGRAKWAIRKSRAMPKWTTQTALPPTGQSDSRKSRGSSASADRWMTRE